MVFFLYGDDSFRRGERLRGLIAPYRAKYASLDLLSVDLEDEPDSWLKARDFLNQPSMFVESKVAVLKEATAVLDKEWVKTIKGQIGAPKTFTFISQKKAPPKDFNFLLEPPVKSQKFNELSLRELEGLLKRELKARNLDFSPEAFRFFFSYIESSAEKTALASSELEKMSLMDLEKPTPLEALREIVAWRTGTEAYVLASEILRLKDFRLKLKSLEKLLLGEDPYYAFNSLAYQARGASALALADYDVSIKSGGLEQAEALLDFVLSP
ncbi:MAG: hypothetical protein UY26_C0001G0065 [Candidatus Jorgensenbacteria bacterium GW2011_GWA1_48_13]|uniref:DNA polymerase III delta N-terminal domain-containing protein n=2 Tax=Candidatus Joergenseniibacteriota TaxID=1752739 RepID=A0A0G1W938_9BACT|nr:MAG: hypothetical protein UY26_C0001G0065 [Candidatus Jorgensenbacteria bacterium GW2011_GWA1_48_13]KKU98943.1 MAG: hypothetical protein UY32_C0010G0004 [Candidatus Jorgensenbacteria bacterium GW2011_GWC1_48_8]KKW15311.1 MAG: hypothetical protein UY55_C0001G0065 [Candidatus Jorgensenbacteria bacterium GW2011_GWB1_50_10]